MRKVTEQIASAFKAGSSRSIRNTRTDGLTVWLHGNAIARKVNGRLEISLAGWPTPTTRERINGILSEYGSMFRLCQQKRASKSFNTETRQYAPFPTGHWQAVSDATP